MSAMNPKKLNTAMLALMTQGQGP
ncbi:protein of unknown function [Pararobbsia alpina]